MATMRDLIDGFTILMKYDPDGEVCADHDVVCAAPTVRADTPTPEDRAKLEELRWRFSKEYDSWSRFV